MMRRPLVIAIIAFLAALALRVANAPMAFAGGAPQISPVDELYHWKRISYSALHFPRVLEFDPDRGDGGAFCPWPPLYDLAAGGAARGAWAGGCGAGGAALRCAVGVWDGAARRPSGP